MARKTAAERKQLVEAIRKSVEKVGLSVKDACKTHEVPVGTYYAWRKEFDEEPGTYKSDGKDEESIAKRIVETKTEHPYYGYAKISMQLKRFHGLDVKTAYVEKVLKQHGLGSAHSGKAARKKGARRFERVEKNELWQMDVMYYTLKKNVRFYLISVLDDYSRFICAHRVCTSQRADNVIDTFSDAVEQHSAPQQVLSDRGSQFHAWNGVSQFRKTLATLGVEHIVASPQSPQTIGKIESWHRNIQRELLREKEFESVEEARDAIAEYVEHYNHERVHMGINYVTPGDRYYGVDQSVQRDMAKPSKDSIYVAARIDGQPIRVEQTGFDELVVKVAGQNTKSVTVDQVRAFFL